MNAFLSLPSQFRWTSHQLANAVPLRLHQAVDFSALLAGAPAAANGIHQRKQRIDSYLPSTQQPALFRIA